MSEHGEWTRLPKKVRAKLRSKLADMRRTVDLDGMVLELKRAIAIIERHKYAIGPVVIEPDWTEPCIICGAKPTVPSTRMCGPCTFGDLTTADGNW